MTDMERVREDLAMIYELRRLIDQSEKETWTKAEIKAWLDQIADDKSKI